MVIKTIIMYVISAVIFHCVGMLVTGILYAIKHKITTREELFATVPKRRGSFFYTDHKHADIIVDSMFWEFVWLVAIICKLFSLLYEGVINIIIYSSKFFYYCVDLNTKRMKKASSDNSSLSKNIIQTEAKNYRMPSLQTCPHCLKKIT